MSIEIDRDRYLKAAHAMQSGVAAEHARGSDDGSRKHLRVGINAAMVDHGGLVALLIAKGIITEAEYVKAIADKMEKEVADYERRLSEEIGTKVTLA